MNSHRQHGKKITPALFIVFACFCSPLEAGDKLDFNRDVRPILSDKCFHCHGPDEASREGDLRLDIESEAKKEFDGYFAIVPGNAEESELYHRITTDDAADLMPPRKSKRNLTGEQKAVLKRWIDEGAEYEDHWSLVPPKRAAPKSASHKNWIRNDVDRFILEKLNEHNLKPSPEADRRTLIRRLSFDLTGLPPAPQEVAAFLDDASPGAYEKVVDQLLGSPRFGEHWARSWLDLARYADSNGFQADQLRDSWAYRDWVIAALNANMPFDQFSIEQLAGDLLPNATLDQKIATGFHRTVTCNVEAGVHPEENRTNQIVDRVNTTGTVWLGTTLGCVQCHDHKYDPFTMKDYYGIFAFFNQTPLEVENKSGKGVSFDFWGPKMDLPVSKEQAQTKAKLQAEVNSMARDRKNLIQKSGGLEQWEEHMRAALKNPPQWQVLPIAKFQSNGGEDFRVLDDQSVLVTGNVPGTAVYTVELKGEIKEVSAIKIETLTHDEIPGKGPGRGDATRTNFILSEIDLRVFSPDSKRGEPVDLHSPRADYSQKNWEVAKAIDGNRKTGWAIGQQFGMPHWASFHLEKPVDLTGGKRLRLTLDQNYGRGRTIGRLRISVLSGPPGVEEVPGDLAAVLSKKKGKRSQTDNQTLDKHYMSSNPALRSLDAKMGKLRKQIAALQPPTTLVMVEMKEKRDTHVMKRGNYLDRGEKVEPATPAALPPFNPDWPSNRLGLAKWLTAPENPLVARVTVNRWWAELFGAGIVATLEDFGTQAQPPTHPGLLDWLALELVESGWSTKHVLKTMVMSAAYRQSSRITPELRQADPLNRWHARGPRFRMTAEMIRDNALAVSGLLSVKSKGAPVMPHQPPGIWRQVGRNEPKWIDAANEDRYRRGVYVIWRRAAPYPSFVNFDAPDRGSCVVSRPRTNTPLQALTLMNDPAYVEMSLALANRLLTEKPKAGVTERLERAFQLVLSRPPSEAERSHLAALIKERIEVVSPAQTDDILKSEGIVFTPNPALDRSELAAWFFVANILLNLDETVTKG